MNLHLKQVYGSFHTGSIFPAVKRINPGGRRLRRSNLRGDFCQDESWPTSQPLALYLWGHSSKSSSPSLKGSWPCWFEGKPCRWDVAKHPLQFTAAVSSLVASVRSCLCVCLLPLIIISFSLQYFLCITPGIKGWLSTGPRCVWQISWWSQISKSPLNCEIPLKV